MGLAMLIFTIYFLWRTVIKDNVIPAEAREEVLSEAEEYTNDPKIIEMASRIAERTDTESEAIPLVIEAALQINQQKQETQKKMSA